jgi:K+-transporting ATPase KdpF subunit
MTLEYGIALALSLMIAAYLVYALLYPERF